MVKQAIRNSFLANVNAAPKIDDVRALAAELAAAKRKASADARARFAGMLAHAAFLAPERVAEVYDAATKGWQGSAVKADPIVASNKPPIPAPAGLWAAYFALIDDALAGQLDALLITQRSAALGALMGDAFSNRLVAASHAYPGVSDAARQPMPELITLEQLAAQPKGSLARRFHDLIIDNTFDLEVLDREELGLYDLPKPLDYLNTRILQSHDLWHIVAGYETTALHEIAISAFQMAQFGHNYSAQFLSMTAGAGAASTGLGYPVLMDTILSAWRHGRETPPLMLIDWETVWGAPTEDIRERYGVAPYASPHPANIIEKSEPVVKVIRALTAPFRLVARPFARA